MRMLLFPAILLGALIVLACTRVVEVPVEVVKHVTVEVIKEVPVEKVVVQQVEVPVLPTPLPAQSPRELTVLVGSGRDTDNINEFFPRSVRIRAGDTLTWKINTDEIHTVSFMDADEPIPAFALPIPDGEGFMANPQVFFPTRPPGAPAETHDGSGFFSAGIMSDEPLGPPGTPPNDTFTLTFDKPGTFNYLCLVHPGFMVATVEVVAANATDVPSPARIDAQAQKEIARLTERIEMAREQNEAKPLISEPGEDDTTIWFVKAGATELVTADMRTQIFEFFPEDLTVKAGDTVVWGSAFFHSVTFDPAPEPPEVFIPTPQNGGPPMLVANPVVFLPAKPAAVHDPTEYFNSGDLGPFSFRTSWALKFEKPGTYKYFCVFHKELGMEGTITVTP